MNSISKNIFTAEKVSKKGSSPAPFFRQVKPVKPQNLESIFENSWVQSSKEGSYRNYYSRGTDNLTSLANNQMIKSGSIRVNSGAQDLLSAFNQTFTEPSSSKTAQNWSKSRILPTVATKLATTSHKSRDSSGKPRTRSSEKDPVRTPTRAPQLLC